MTQNRKSLTELRSEFNSDEQFGQAILQEVEKLARENPCYVYEPHQPEDPQESLIYSYISGSNGSKGCLIGQALQSLGVFLEEKNRSFYVILMANGFTHIDDSPSLCRLNRIQNVQDNRNKWGSCING